VNVSGIFIPKFHQLSEKKRNKNKQIGMECAYTFRNKQNIMDSISLSSGMRASLLGLQNTNKLLNRTQERLSTGRKINSAIDGPGAYFSSLSLRDRAEGLESRLDGIGQAIQTIRAAETGLDTIRSLLDQAKAIATDASDKSTSTDRAGLGKQFNEVLRQIQTVAADTSYLGVNLVQRTAPSDPLADDEDIVIQFNERINDSTLVVTGFNMYGPVTELDPTTGEAERPLTLSSSNNTFTSMMVQTHGDGDSWELNWAATDYRDSLRTVISQIELFDDQLQVESSKLANHLNVITLREDFTKNIVNEFKTGADELTVADLNEEGANLLALQTSQSLGISSLSLASQARQSILRLLG
jgi:flagellin